MNIAFLIQDITTAGGTERTTCCLANTFARQGHVVSVVSVFKENDIPCYTIDSTVKIRYVCSEKYNFGLGLKERALLIMKQLRKVRANEELKQADVVISQKLLASVMIWLTGNAHKAIACEHFKYEMYTPFLRRVRNCIYQSFLATVVLTENDRRKFAVALSHVEVIPNMVSVIPLPHQKQDSKTIITVGRLERQKGYDLLLQALPGVFAKHPDWHLNIFGEGGELSFLTKQRDELGLTDFVNFEGYVQHIEQEYASSTFFVMSSRFEGFPMVLLEAAACGLPIVSFDCPEGPGVLLKNGGGILVPPEDVAGMTNALNTIIENVALREELSRQSTDVVAPYTSGHIYDQWMNLFQKYSILPCKQA